jgi:hypothetical protein
VRARRERGRVLPVRVDPDDVPRWSRVPRDGQHLFPTLPRKDGDCVVVAGSQDVAGAGGNARHPVVVVHLLLGLCGIRQVCAKFNLFEVGDLLNS